MRLIRCNGLPGLVPVDVVMAVGDSNTSGARNNVNELPVGGLYSTPHYAPDANAYIWDDTTANAIVQFVAGPLEQQPGGAAYVDPAYTNTIGYGGEFLRQWRKTYPTKPLYFFNMQRGGGRFTDANTTFARACNYNPALGNGAYNELKVSWAAFKAALAAQGKRPNIVACRISMGANPALDATESANLQADLTGFIAALRTDIIGSAKVIMERLSSTQTAVSANAATVRAAQQAVVQADTARCELMNTDGMACLVDNIHFTSPAHAAIGRQFAYHALNLWYPQKEWAFLGGKPCVHQWRPGDVRNTFNGNAVQTMRDLVGGFDASQATATKQPALGKVALADGSNAYYGQGDGVDDSLVCTAGAFCMDGSYGVFAAAKGGALANGTLVGEGGAGANAFANFMRNDAAGNMQFIHRNDAGTVNGPTTLVANGYNSTANFLATWDDGAQVIGQVNGTQGAAVPYSGAARGATSTNRMSFWALNYAGGGAEIHYGNSQMFEVWGIEGLPDATYLANARAYVQREYGTA